MGLRDLAAAADPLDEVAVRGSADLALAHKCVVRVRVQVSFLLQVLESLRAGVCGEFLRRRILGQLRLVHAAGIGLARRHQLLVRVASKVSCACSCVPALRSRDRHVLRLRGGQRLIH